MAYTKGPWTVIREYNVYSTELNRIVASCGGYQNNLRQEETHLENVANAHLVAAAPDLLEACKLVLHLIKNHQAYDKDAQSILEQAIAKAKGEVSNER